MFSIDRISSLQTRISDIQTKLNLPMVPDLSFNSYLENAMKSAEINAMNPDQTQQSQQSTQSTPRQIQAPRQIQTSQTQQPNQAQTNIFNISFEKPASNLTPTIDPKMLAEIVSVDPKTNRLVIDLEKLKMIAQSEDNPDEEFIEEIDDVIENYDYDSDLPVSNHSIDDLIRRAAEKYGIDPRLVAAIAETESNGNQHAISPVGAIGVMQLMPGTAAALGVNPYDKAQNIEGGAKYLSQMLDTFGGDVRRAVAAYNAGPGAVQKYGGIPPYAETQNYVRKVIDLYQ